ncbi:hypothetical protein [Niabella hibiscisoli]|uniref:hypothetical protein n=1 Tax=Niabella hibiscisoli TaxID=1825928 RepID=UPI001F0D7078|nr:hypothetical protein [Niabella hibiscisoli]MCH5715323.1 hypothetical protein [Niabella hibiscisoli]
MRRIFQYAAPYKGRFYWSVILAIVLAALTPVRPLLIQLTVDQYVAQSLPKMVIYVTIIQMGIILIETLMRFAFSLLPHG